MEIDVLPVGLLETNCYLITCPRTREAALIDPGWDDPSILEAIRKREASVKIILLTHAHFDHIGGVSAMIRATGAPLALHKDDLPLLRVKGWADMWNIPIPPCPDPDRFLEPDETLEIGSLRLKVLFTPGHTPGHVSFYEAEHSVLFDGDVLFKQGVGRTDIPGGDAAQLLDSIRRVLFALPDEVIVYPGHGPATTIGEEKRLNPWVQA